MSEDRYEQKLRSLHRCVQRVLARIDGREELTFGCFCDVCTKILPNVRTQDDDKEDARIAVEQPSPTYEYPHEEARRAVENGAPIIESMTITVNTNDTRDKQAESVPAVAKPCTHGLLDCDDCCWLQGESRRSIESRRHR